MRDEPEKIKDEKKVSFVGKMKDIFSHMKQPTSNTDESLNDMRYKQEDLIYMRSLSEAVVQHSQQYAVWVMGVIVFTILVAVIWMSWATLDTIVRTEGKVIPSNYVQKVQSLEGGLIAEFLVKEGDVVSINQPLVKINDIPFLSSFEETSIKYLELKARKVRLIAEASLTDFGTDSDVLEIMPHLLILERELFISNKAELEQKLEILNQQVKQAKNQLLETRAKKKQLSRTVELLKREVQIKKPLVERKVLNEVEFLQLQGKEVEAVGALDSVKLSIPRIQSLLDEAESTLEHTKLEFVSRSHKELNEVSAEVSRISELQISLADKVARTTLRSPVTGTVKRIFVKSIGGVVRPGADIIEIVPEGDILLVEARIKPADIAHVVIGQETRIKFSAYDFAIYGSMRGRVQFIGADTITDEEGNSYYVARIEPARKYLGNKDFQQFIKVGMTSQVDIITGKKTILSYLLKPINRAMDSALRER